MPQQVNVPGVGPVEFPDGMSQGDMAAAIERNYAPELHAARNREDVGAGMALRGVPVLGAYVPQAEAAIRSIAQPEGSAQGATYGERYAENLRRQQAQYKLAEQEQPWTSEALKIGGGVVGLAPLGATAVGARALGATGPLWARIPLGAASGAGISAADAAARGEDVKNAAMLGGGLGAAAPVVGAAIGRGVEAVRDLRPENVAARLGRGAAQAESLTPAQIAARGAELGPQGTLAEFGPNFEGLAQGVATQPGPGKSVIFDTMGQRAAGTRARIEDAVTGALGPRQNMAELNLGERLAQGVESSPLYDAWRSTQVHATPEIRAMLPVLQRDGLLADAVRRMQLEGRPVMENVFSTANVAPSGPGTVAGRALGPATPGPTGPTTEAWDYVKRAIDARISAARQAGDRDLSRIYQGVKERIDAAIERANPDAAQVWRAARNTWASREANINARELGQDIMNVRRDELAQTLANMGAPERNSVMEGIRDKFAEMIDRSARGDTQVRDALRAPAVRDKIMMVAPNRQAAAELFQQAEREAQFAETHRRLLLNSQTAARTAMGEVTKPQPGTGIGNYLRGVEFSRPASWFGLGRPAQLAGGSLIPGAAEHLAASRAAQRYERARAILAQQLMQQGQGAQNTLLRMMQPPPPTSQNASRFGTVLTQGIAPLF